MCVDVVFFIEEGEKSQETRREGNGLKGGVKVRRKRNKSFGSEEKDDSKRRKEGKKDKGRGKDGKRIRRIVIVVGIRDKSRVGGGINEIIELRRVLKEFTIAGADVAIGFRRRDSSVMTDSMILEEDGGSGTVRVADSEGEIRGRGKTPPRLGHGIGCVEDGKTDSSRIFFIPIDLECNSIVEKISTAITWFSTLLSVRAFNGPEGDTIERGEFVRIVIVIIVIIVVIVFVGGLTVGVCAVVIIEKADVEGVGEKRAVEPGADERVEGDGRDGGDAFVVVERASNVETETRPCILLIFVAIEGKGAGKELKVLRIKGPDKGTTIRIRVSCFGPCSTEDGSIG